MAVSPRNSAHGRHLSFDLFYLAVLPLPRHGHSLGIPVGVNHKCFCRDNADTTWNDAGSTAYVSLDYLVICLRMVESSRAFWPENSFFQTFKLANLLDFVGYHLFLWGDQQCRIHLLPILIERSMIKKFVQDTIVFAVVTFLVINLVCIGLMRFPIFANALFPDQRWLWSYHRVRQTYQPLETDVLVVGDSVTAQIFLNYENEGYLPTLRDATAGGLFVMIAHALENNPQIRDVYYVISPLSIGAITSEFTTMGFLKPFFSVQNLTYFSPPMFDLVREKPLAIFYILPIAKFIPIDEIQYERSAFGTLPPYAVTELMRVMGLCNQTGVTLHLVAPPVSERVFEEYNGWESIRTSAANTPLAPLVTDYLDDLVVLPDDVFVDDFHFSGAYLSKQREEMQATILAR